jgi:hypothetical protein
MQMYCTFVLFVNQHFPGLPASGTHCINTLRLTAELIQNYCDVVHRAAAASSRLELIKSSTKQNNNVNTEWGHVLVEKNQAEYGDRS